ncbi:uncharacterized protein LOC108858918 [Raphanus sativus]|uniref:Uncharacterized protein LOC108858918 n=1 Tax=Raphanus sativus TaxID=3726 RepID=A0A6J0NV22_RAPSA|nr:uncharacterized protein LOC108858918 [Raphanus sativus]
MILNNIEEDLDKLRDKIGEALEDACQWRRAAGFKQEFSTSETWKLIRAVHEKRDWSKCIWFSQATPKYAFMMWLACLNRLSTMDRIARWNRGVDTTCVLCKNALENRDHLFFECSYSLQLWESLAKGIMGSSFTNSWPEIVSIATAGAMERRKRFCFRYAFHAAMYSLWRERNRVKHGERLTPVTLLKKLVDKGIRNKLSLLRQKGVKGMQDSIQLWFSTRG